MNRTPSYGPEKNGLDHLRLENVHKSTGKTLARCPVCAEAGHDKSGEHLIMHSDGRFGCVAHPKTEGHAHRRRIFELAGGAVSKRTIQPANIDQKPGRCFATVDEAIHELERICRAACACRWRYDFEDGKPAFVICRFDLSAGKTYRPVRKDTDGWRIGGMKVGTRPLYHLSSLLAADPDEPVFVTEGEKCADALVGLNLLATTSSHGAKSAKGSDWTPLAGRNIVLLPDNDEAGASYVRDVGLILAGLTPPASVQVLALPGIEALGGGADVADWLPGRESGQARDALLRLAAESPVEDTSFALLGVASAADWLMEPEPPPPEYLLDGVFERRDKLLIVGPTKTRKSFLSMQLALCLSAGVPFVGIAVPTPSRVLLVDLENKPNWLKRRLRRIAEGLGLSPSQAESLKILSCCSEPQKTLEIIIDHALCLKPDVVFIDPIYKVDCEDENDQESRKRLVARLGDLISEIGCAIVLVHHDPKGDTSMRNVRDRGSGSAVLNRDVDATLAINLKSKNNPNGADQKFEILSRNAPSRPSCWVQFTPGQYFIPVEATPADSKESGAPGHGAPKPKRQNVRVASRQQEILAAACLLLTGPTTMTEFCERVATHLKIGKKAARDLAEEVGKTDGFSIKKMRTFPKKILIGPTEAGEKAAAVSQTS